MSTRYSNKDLENIVRAIDIEAKQAGLIPLDARVVYHPGNASNGISAALSCFRQREDGQYENIRSYFLPEFTYKTSRKEQYKQLEAALNVFHAIRRLDEAAAKL